MELNNEIKKNLGISPDYQRYLDELDLTNTYLISKAKNTQSTFDPANEAPANELPANVAPANELPANVAPANEAPANELPANEAPANVAPANEAPANELPANEDISISRVNEPSIINPELNSPTSVSNLESVNGGFKKIKKSKKNKKGKKSKQNPMHKYKSTRRHTR